VTFLLDNIVLIVLAVVSGALLLWPKLNRSGGATAVSPLEATQLINHRNAIVVDVRDEKDFATGSLAGARNIPSAQLAERASELARFKARPVVVVCGAGQQSARALEAFKAQGFTETYSLAGGTNAWRQASLPLVHPARDPARKGKSDNRRGTRAAAALPPESVAVEPIVEPAGAVGTAGVPLAEVVASTEEPSSAKVV
jgi:rhodanese-related sulfurtransferase